MSGVWYTVQQPILFPPLYMVERFARCHDVVVLDQAQFCRENTQFKLMSSVGVLQNSVHLTGASFRLSFAERRVSRGEAWKHRVLATAQTLYGRQAAYKELRPWFAATVEAMAEEAALDRFCLRSVMALAALLGLQTRFRMGSEMLAGRPAEPTAWVAAFGPQLGATDYIQGEKAMRDYFVEGPFESYGCRTWGQDFSFDYRSNGDWPGAAGLSVLDLLFVHGVDATREAVGVAQGPGPRGTEKLVTR